MNEGFDVWLWIFFGTATLFVSVLAVRGWQRGFARQLVNLLALVTAYGVAIFGGELVSTLLRPFVVDGAVVRIGGGLVLAAMVYVAISAVGKSITRRTAELGPGAARLGSGVGGSILGVVSAIALVWLTSMGLRMLGTIAETEMERLSSVAESRASIDPQPSHEANGVVRGLANLKHSLESGRTGEVIASVDPLPDTLYATLRKIARLIAEPDRVDFFLAYPGVTTLTDHPTIAALTHDPEISRNLERQNFLALLGNRNILRAANDPELKGMLRDFQLEEALDAALDRPLPPIGELLPDSGLAPEQDD